MADVAARSHEQSEPRRQDLVSRRPFPWRKALTYVLLILGTMVALGPFLWMLAASLMTSAKLPRDT